MSDPIEAFKEQASQELSEIGKEAAEEFASRMVKLGKEIAPRTADAILDLSTMAAEFKKKALLAPDEETRDLYEGEVETVGRRIKTILLAEKVVAEEKAAEAVMETFTGVLTRVMKVGLKMLQKAAVGAVGAGLAGPIGGVALAAIFPFGE